MAVSAHNQITGKDKSLFRKERVLDPCLAHFEILGKLLLPSKLPQDLTLLGRLNILVWGKMIRDQDNPLFVEDRFGTGPFELPNGQGRRNIIPQGDVHPGIDQLARVKLV